MLLITFLFDVWGITCLAQALLKADFSRFSLLPEQCDKEFQTNLIKMKLDLIASRAFEAGMYRWALSDLKIGQDIIRFEGMNHKGVFNRD